MFANRIVLLLFVALVTASEEEANSKSAEKGSKSEEIPEGANSTVVDCSKVPDLICSEAPPPYCHRCDGSGDALMRCSHCHGMCENQAHKMCKQCFGSEMFISFCCCKDWNCECETEDEDSQAEDGAEDNEEGGNEEKDEEKEVNALAAQQDVQDTVAAT